MDVSKIPSSLQRIPRWVVWKGIQKPNKTKVSKMPYQINGKAASSTDESTWVDFLTAKDHANKFDGIGLCARR